jgi:phasin family protein
MIASVEDFQKFAKDNAENTQKMFGTLSKGMQTIAAEIGDYSKKSFEEGSAVLEQLAGAKSLDKVVEIQSEYAKKAYESLVAQSTKVSELYVDLAKEMAKPFEGLMPKAK